MYGAGTLTCNDFMAMIRFAIDMWLVGFGLAWKFGLKSKNVICLVLGILYYTD